MNVLVACEESQTVCKAFRDKGFNAFSCDIQPCSGGHPEWHIWDSVSFYLKTPCLVCTMDDVEHYIDKWDLIIAHPPCTYLTKVSANSMFPNGILSKERFNHMQMARSFFFQFLDISATCKHVAIENPVPLKICNLPKYDQIIQPYFFGEPFSKQTCLWLRGLPPLMYTYILTEYVSFHDTRSGSKARSKFFKGVACAMAEQWGEFILNNS